MQPKPRLYIMRLTSLSVRDNNKLLEVIRLLLLILFDIQGTGELITTKAGEMRKHLLQRAATLMGMHCFDCCIELAGHSLKKDFICFFLGRKIRRCLSNLFMMKRDNYLHESNKLSVMSWEGPVSNITTRGFLWTDPESICMYLTQCSSIINGCNTFYIKQRRYRMLRLRSKATIYQIYRILYLN